jgi:hypothetical protein
MNCCIKPASKSGSAYNPDPGYSATQPRPQPPAPQPPAPQPPAQNLIEVLDRIDRRDAHVRALNEINAQAAVASKKERRGRNNVYTLISIENGRKASLVEELSRYEEEKEESLPPSTFMEAANYVGGGIAAATGSAVGYAVSGTKYLVGGVMGLFYDKEESFTTASRTRC